MKHELKIDFKETEEFSKFLENSYSNGILVNKTNFLKIEKNDPIYPIFKGLTNLFVKVCNEEIIEGFVKCIIQEENEYVRLYPCSIIYNIENKKYVFVI